MEIFYLKVNQQINITWHYLEMWLDIVHQFPIAKTYIVCDDTDLQNAITTKIKNKVEGYNVEFIPSARDSEELRYIVDNVIVPRWKPAAYAHLTSFLHARDNGYKNFWNIDADDLGLYVKPRRVAKLLNVVKNYAIERKIDMFSLDMWYTIHSGNHWTFGVTYTDNSVNWIELMKSHCQDHLFYQSYGEKLFKANADHFCTHLMKLNCANIRSFYVENLYIVHHSDNPYRKPFWGLKYCANGRSYWPLFCRDFGMGDQGSLPIPKDVVKFDIGITCKESQSYFKLKSTTEKTKDYTPNVMFKLLELNNALVDTSITVILPLCDTTRNVRLCFESLLSQNFQSFRIVVTDAGLNKTALEFCRKMRNQFGERIKILTGIPKEKLFDAGLQAAKGRYVMFITGNDAFLEKAFQFLYAIAEDTHADVVQISSFLAPNSQNAFSMRINTPDWMQNIEHNFSIITNEPGWGQNFQALSILSQLNDKIKALFSGMISLSVYNKLIRREFLEEERISVPFADSASQSIFNLQCLMLAENYVRVPYPLYARVSAISPPPNYTEDFFTKIKSLAKCIEALEKLDDEVFYFDEYAEEKILLRRMYDEFLNEVFEGKHGKSQKI